MAFPFPFDISPQFVPEQYNQQQQIVRRATDTDRDRFFEKIDAFDQRLEEFKKEAPFILDKF